MSVARLLWRNHRPKRLCPHGHMVKVFAERVVLVPRVRWEAGRDLGVDAAACASARARSSAVRSGRSFMSQCVGWCGTRVTVLFDCGRAEGIEPPSAELVVCGLFH